MSSPLTLTGRLDDRPSRWLWLLKMFAAVPHFVVLTALAAAFLALTAVAGVAILATGRYPRALFDVNVGILRWNWRVGFYVYAALGTDRYPPFTLRAVAYPAELDVAYPERLSRGLVLAKGLLAAPHLVIVALIVLDIVRYPIPTSTAAAEVLSPGGYSVLNLLVVVAGAFLLITGSYPRPLFELLMGVNRWIYRVVVYVAFMSDDYPPFRLDAGAVEAVRS